MNNIQFIIYGTHSRDIFIQNMVKILGEENCIVQYNDNHFGEVLDLCIKAWETGIASNKEWICVIQDDMELCDNFMEILPKMLEVVGTDRYLLSLFNYEYKDISLSDLTIDDVDSPYLVTSVMAGCINIMRRELAIDCINFIKNHAELLILPDDVAALKWAEVTNVTILTTIPCLVQHMGDISAIDPHRPKRITRNYLKTAVGNWSNFNLEFSLRKKKPTMKQKLLKKRLYGGN